MLTSKSTAGCRLTANSPAVIRCVKREGLTTGKIDPADAYGKSKPKGKPTKSKRSGKPRAKNHKTERVN